MKLIGTCIYLVYFLWLIFAKIYIDKNDNKITQKPLEFFIVILRLGREQK